MDILFPIASYLIGAIPFGLIVGKCAGIDVRTAGSKNIGATNVSRLLGKKRGILTLILDCLKGFVPIFVASQLLGEEGRSNNYVLLCGIMAVIGHMFPLYLGFKGGKGVATGLGVFLFLSPPAIGLSMIVFLGTVALSGYVSAGSLLSSALFPVWLWLLGQPSGMIVTGGCIALLIWFKHHENIGRLLHGEEKSWKKVD